jgi:hypothetical protein
MQNSQMSVLNRKSKADGSELLLGICRACQLENVGSFQLGG